MSLDERFQRELIPRSCQGDDRVGSAVRNTLRVPQSENHNQLPQEFRLITIIALKYETPIRCRCCVAGRRGPRHEPSQVPRCLWVARGCVSWMKEKEAARCLSTSTKAQASNQNCYRACGDSSEGTGGIFIRSQSSTHIVCFRSFVQM